MSAAQSKIPRRESIISICLLALIFIIGLSIILRQFNFRTSTLVVDENSGKNIPDLMKPLTPSAFEPFSQIDIYEAENLYEKINGKAPLYLESGFVQLFTRWYVNSSDEELKFQLYLYDMAEPQNAFSVYSTQRRQDALTVPAFNPAFGYKTENALFFTYGKFYVELVGTAASDELLEAMTAFAEKISETFPAEKQIETVEIKLLSGSDFVPGSIKLYLANALGFEALTNTYTAHLKVNGQSVTVFLSKRPTEQDAKKLIDSYANFLIALDVAENKITLPLSSAKVFDYFGSTEIIFNNGSFLAGIHEADNLETAIKAASLLNRILAGVEK